MLQRKQSLFLALAALLSFSTWLFPVATYVQGTSNYVLRTTGFFTAEGAEVTDVAIKVPFAAVLTLIGAALTACIFLYKDRQRQVRFVRGTYLVVLGIVAFLFITDNSVQAYLEQAGTVDSTYGLSFILPLIVLVLAFLAERAIKADDELVRSADRLR